MTAEVIAKRRARALICSTAISNLCCCVSRSVSTRKNSSEFSTSLARSRGRAARISFSSFRSRAFNSEAIAAATKAASVKPDPTSSTVRHIFQDRCWPNTQYKGSQKSHNLPQGKAFCTFVPFSFLQRPVVHDGKIPKFSCRWRGHNSNLFLYKHAPNSPRAQAENLRLLASVSWSDIIPVARRDWIDWTPPPSSQRRARPRGVARPLSRRESSTDYADFRRLIRLEPSTGGCLLGRSILDFVIRISGFGFRHFS